MENEKEYKREQEQIRICDLADKYLDEEIAKGAPFTEGLANWAFNKAQQESISNF